MYAERPEAARIANYSGPYERWIFSKELGRPYAFPAITGKSSGYYTGLLEGTDRLPSDNGLTSRLPPLWNPEGRPRAVTPFAFHDTNNITADAGQEDSAVALLLSKIEEDVVSRGGMRPRFRVNFPVATEAWTRDYRPYDPDRDPWTRPATRPRAILGVIDDAIPFAHRAFLDRDDATRMSYCWLQSAASRDGAAVPFGREFANAEIDALRSACGTDDRRLYREAGAVDALIAELGTHLLREATHGSLVAGLAGGNDSRYLEPLGDDIQIIAVQLPNTIAWDTSGFGKEMYMLSAMHYIFNRARLIAAHYAEGGEIEELPLVLNFSYGWSASRHDGGSSMETAIEELLAERKALQPASAIVMPSGNNFPYRMHGQVTDQEFGETRKAIFDWKVLPDDRTSSYIEIWLPEGGDYAGWTVTVTPPEGTRFDEPAVLEISADPDQKHGDPRRFLEPEIGGKIVGQLSADKNRGTRWRVMLALIPTVFIRGQDRRAPSGNWRFEIRQNGGQALLPQSNIDIWVQRDDDPSELSTGGRQSWLTMPDAPIRPPHPLRRYTTPLGFVRGYGAMNGVASSPTVTRVAGYTLSTTAISDYSSGGGIRQDRCGTLTPVGPAPDICASADRARSLPGIPSLGVVSGSGARIVGTSGAAPAAARVMVANAAAGRPLMDGMEPRPPLPPIETPGPASETLHAARWGMRRVPAVTR